MRWFISQPMADLTYDEIINEREKIKKIIYGEDPEAYVIDSFVTEELSGKNVPLKFIARAIQNLSEADIIIFAENYENSRGCLVEEFCARKYGIKTFYISKKGVTRFSTIKSYNQLTEEELAFANFCKDHMLHNGSCENCRYNYNENGHSCRYKYFNETIKYN